MATTPKRPRSHVIGDIGRTFVKLQLEKWGWTADIVQSDYGEDLDCTIFSSGRKTALHFRCQVKSVGATKKQAKLHVVRVNSTTCASWAQSYHPVFVVVYDQAVDEAYFLDATAILRRKPSKLTRQSVSFSVPKSENLSSGQQQLYRDVQAHYAAFLRMPDKLHCVAFPIRMPRYRAVLPQENVSIESWDWRHRHRDGLPAWTLVFETIQSEHLYGLSRTFSSSAVDDIHHQLTEGLRNLETTEGPDEWTAFSCAPIGFEAEQPNGPSVWTGEITEWRSLARIDGKVVDDHSYAFDPPRGFVTEVARHASSWDDYYHIDPARDLAIQLYATAPLTPAYRSRSQSMRKNAVGQLMPWSCALRQIDDLASALRKLSLTFSPVALFSTDQTVAGVIHSPMFVVDDEFTAIPGPMNWQSMDDGAVRHLIRDAPQGSIPGSPSSEEVVDHFLSKAEHLKLDPAERFFGVEHDFPNGLPVDLTRRKILVERFHSLTGEVDETTCQDFASAIKERLAGRHASLGEAEVSFAPFSTHLYPMLRLAVEWKPRLHLSSAQAFESVEKSLLTEFDRLLPRRSTTKVPIHRTFAVLSLCGNIHFDQNYWDQWKRANEESL